MIRPHILPCYYVMQCNVACESSAWANYSLFAQHHLLDKIIIYYLYFYFYVTSDLNLSGITQVLDHEGFDATK